MKGILMTVVASADSAKSSVSIQPLCHEELRKMDAYWRAANYLSVGQIYLYANPLLREPLSLHHVKPRLLGHWGTTPGLNFIYVHLNRVIKKYDLNVIYVCGPGHGGPGMVANTYLEGTYTELYTDIQQNEEGLRKLFKQFSFPVGIPSHAALETLGSIHVGGELGYALVHAYGAVFDNPDLVACCVVGDGESETLPLAASWHSNKFLNPARDGAEIRGRQTRRRDVARAPGAGGRSRAPSGTPDDSRKLAEELPARNVVRRQRETDSGIGGTGAHRRSAHGRESPRQRWLAAEGTRDARLPNLRHTDRKARHRNSGIHQSSGRLFARRDETEPGSRELPGVWARRDRVQSARCFISGDG